jgi:hypothetical protein
LHLDLHRDRRRQRFTAKHFDESIADLRLQILETDRVELSDQLVERAAPSLVDRCVQKRFGFLFERIPRKYSSTRRGSCFVH